MPSKPNILIVGQTGSGKSNSLEALLKGPRQKEIAVIDLEQKGFPFLFDAKQLGFFSEPKDLPTTEADIKKVLADPKIKLVIYDSLSKYLELVREFSKVIKTGWDIWNHYNQKLFTFIEDNKKSGKVIIATILDEVVMMDLPDGGKTSRLRAYVQGKQYEGKLEKEFLIVLFTLARKEANGEVKHVFQTHTDGLSSAKAPQWMQLPNYTANDLSVVVEKLYQTGVLVDETAAPAVPAAVPPVPAK